MALSLRRLTSSLFLRPPLSSHNFRSDAALKALSEASEAKTPNLVLYNYPSFSGAFSALFAHLYHSHLNLPCLILPFSSVVPFRVDDSCIKGLEKCYLFGFLGPNGFALELSKKLKCKVIAFDHRQEIPLKNNFDENLEFHVNLDKSTCIAVYEYFSTKLAQSEHNGDKNDLLNPIDQDRVERLFKFIEDGDLRRFALPGTKAFHMGIKKWHSKLNCITNARMFEQLMWMRAEDIIRMGDNYISSRQNDANKILDKAFKLQLGRGIYGECLCVKSEGKSHLSNEIGEELCQKSIEAGLRPIGAVIYMQRRNLKMCLRSTDSKTDVSVIAKAYGGGGTSSSSSFIIRMDEYNQWRSIYS